MLPRKIAMVLSAKSLRELFGPNFGVGGFGARLVDSVQRPPLDWSDSSGTALRRDWRSDVLEAVSGFSGAVDQERWKSWVDE